MSKKIAGGAQAIVLDVKLGYGAFMEDLEQASTLAEMMVNIAKSTDRNAVALLSDMNQPLGHAVGNALEVLEAIATLQGGGPADFRDHCLDVASHMLVMGGSAPDESTGRKMVKKVIANGQAWERFRELVRAQGGDVDYVDHPERLPKSALVETVPSPRSGYLSEINARDVGESAVELGAGRAKKGDPIDHTVGIVVHHKVGDQVESGQPLFTLHANRKEQLNAVRQRLLKAHMWSDEPVQPLPLFYDVVR
jgi:pyrimidine-nucleoside phosphorylase